MVWVLAGTLIVVLVFAWALAAAANKPMPAPVEDDRPPADLGERMCDYQSYLLTVAEQAQGMDRVARSELAVWWPDLDVDAYLEWRAEQEDKELFTAEVMLDVALLPSTEDET